MSGPSPRSVSTVVFEGGGRRQGRQPAAEVVAQQVQEEGHEAYTSVEGRRGGQGYYIVIFSTTTTYLVLFSTTTSQLEILKEM